LLHPRHGWTAFTFWSHKVLRWACPFLLLAALATNVALAAVGGRLYAALLAGQFLFYALALLGTRLPARPKVCKAVRLATMFGSMNAALLVGFARWARGSQRAAWERTARAQAGAQRPPDETHEILAPGAETQEIPVVTPAPPQPAAGESVNPAGAMA